MITDKLQTLGAATIRSVTGFGRAGIMLFGAILGKPDPRRGFGLLVKQLYVIGVMSLLIILVSGLFIGMVQHGLTFGNALEIYTLLTIGDGLVAHESIGELLVERVLDAQVDRQRHREPAVIETRVLVAEVRVARVRERGGEGGQCIFGNLGPAMQPAMRKPLPARIEGVRA